MEKLFESEMKVMDVLWEYGSISAKEVSLILADSIGWNKNTTYTVISKLVNKGFIERKDPGFICTPLFSKDDIRKSETNALINKFFAGSRKALFSALIEDESVSADELKELRKLLNKHE